MSKEELLKYLIAEIDLIMHDKDYRFENANGTWYSRESCRDLTNEEVFEELRTELRQFADLEAKLAESEKSKESYRLQNEQHHLQLLQFYSRLGVEAFGADIHEKALETLMIMKEELEERNGVRRALSACNHQNDEFADMIKKLVNEKEKLKQQLAEKDKEIEYQESMKILAVENQNKNAIEQLEQIINLFEPYENEEKDTILCANNGISFLEFIDNQIKQLKEGK